MIPAVTLKLATSIDGRIATASGESRWITGEAARAEVHRLRAAHDAVLVGIGTALADDPELSARTTPPPSRQPLRVVLDRKLRLPTSARVVQSVSLGPVAVVAAPDGPRGDGLRMAGAAVLHPAPQPGEGEIAAVLRALAESFGVARVFVEGGGQIAAAFLRVGLVDRIEWFRAPILLGGDGRPAIADLALARLADAPGFRRVAQRELGPDLWESYERAARP